MDDRKDRAEGREVGRMVMQNRITGEIVGDGSPIYGSDFPFTAPSPETVVWRYLDWFKFEDLVSNRRLYFRRADRLDDQMEGRFSQANREFQTSLWQRFNEAYLIRRDRDQEARINEAMRYRVFLNCWQIAANESARMWKLYTKSWKSVVVRSRCDLIDRCIDGRAYQPMLVRYVDQEEPRPEFHSLAPFVFKDPGFAFEKEVRFIFVASPEETIYEEEERDFSRVLAIRPEELIREVRTHPDAPKRFRRCVADFCARLLSEAQVQSSSLPRGAVTSAPIF